MRAAPSPDDIDITDLWRALRRSLPRILFASAAAGALTIGALSLVAKKYTSEAELAVVAKGTANPFADPKQSNAPDLLTLPVDKEAINTHVRALQSTDLATRIATELKLANRVEFNSALGSVDRMGALLRLIGIGGPRAGESELDRVLAAYYAGLEVYSPKESRFIGIRFTSTDPALAAEIANRLATLYRERLATSRLTETGDVQKALQPKISKLMEEVAQADAEVERFRAEANIFKGGPQSTGLNEQQLGELTAELTKAQSARSEAEARARSARDLMQRGAGDVLPDVQRSPLIQNLIQQRVRVERQIAELSATLLPGHPRMQQLNAELKGLKQQLATEVGKVVDGLEKEAKVAALREESIRKSLSEIKARVASTGTDEVKLRQLEAVAKSKRSELERLQAQFEANRARADSGAVPVEAQIISTARPSSVPSAPKKGPYTALVMVATLLFGTAWSVTRALLRGARSGAAGQGPRPSPAIGLMPGDLDPALPVFAAPAVASLRRTEVSAPAALARNLLMPSIEALARHLLSITTDQSGVRSIIVGESQSVDAGPEALGLARALAAERAHVVLIDWTLEGHSPLAASLDMTKGPGVKQLLAGLATFENVVRREAASNVHVIAPGEGSIDAPALQDPDRINLVLDALDEVYDQIIVTGRYEYARALFEIIEGRFDAGITVGDPRRRVSVMKEAPNTFLGFEVTEIVLLRYERSTTDQTRPERAGRRRLEAVAG